MQKFTILIKAMRKLFTVYFLILIIGTSCSGQMKFEEFGNKFPSIDLPIDSIQFHKSFDSLNTSMFNYIVWDSQPKEDKNSKQKIVGPKVFKNGALINLSNFGKVSESPLEYETVDGKSGQFYTKVYSIGRINLHPKYITLIVKTYNTELAYYDLYSFTKDGKRLSAVPLFKYAHNNMLIDSIDYVYIKSSILLDGCIKWFENNRGLKTSRIYKLRDDGYFEIIKEEKTGEFEY